MLGLGRLPDTELGNCAGDVRCNQWTCCGSFRCCACHQVRPGQKRLVLTLDGVDRWRASPSLGLIENVVMDQRADLNQLHRHGRRDHPRVEYVPNVGHRNGQSRAKPLPTAGHHSEA